MAEPGLFPDIDERVYHSDRTSLSVSGAKVLLKSPAKYHWQLDHPVYRDVFDFGTAAHKMVLGVGADLVVHDYDAEKVKSPKSTNAWKTQQAEVRKAGGVLLLQDELDAVTAMAAGLREHKTAMHLLGSGAPEVSAYALDPATGVMRRGRFDWLNEDMLVDYKTAAASDARSFGQSAAKFGYDMQAAWYTDLALDNGLNPRGFVFIVQEKEPPYEVACIQLDPNAVEGARNLNAAALALYRDCAASKAWPTTTPDRVVSAEVPSWRWSDYVNHQPLQETA